METPVVACLIAWTWFFRPYGWFGQKIRFFGTTCGDLIQVFVDHVRIHEAEAATRKIMVGYTGGRRDKK